MKKILFLLICCVAMAKVTTAQDYIYVSYDGIRKYMRFDVGYTQWSMQQTDSAARLSRGLHLHNEVKIISAFWKNRSRITVHDAFYLGLDMGGLSSERHVSGIGEDAEYESKFSMVINMGYLFLGGYRVQKWGALAGIDFRWRASTVGDLTMPNLNGPLFYLSTPLVVRGELGLSKNYDAKRVIVTGWSNIGKKHTPYQSLRIELPLDKEGRFWFAAQYTAQDALAEDMFNFTAESMTKFRQYMIGFRIGLLP